MVVAATVIMDLELDHALILHDDLEKGSAALKGLGFTATPRGYHGKTLGTANTTVMMPDRRTYFEVTVVAEPTAHNADKRDGLGQHGAHLFGLAFKGNARSAADRFKALGIENGEAFEFARPVELPGGVEPARFAVAQLQAGTLPGLFSFVCEQFTPGVVWRSDCLDHPNDARSIAGGWGVAEDLDTLAKHWHRLFGEAVKSTGDGLEIVLGAAKFSFLTPYRWTEMFGEAPECKTPHLRALEIKVGSFNALEQALGSGDVSWDHLGSMRRVEDRYGLGTMLLFST